MKTPARLAFLLPGGLALLAGLDAALLLLGVPAPVTLERLPLVHGPLLVLGFVGTVISLERAVALRRWWGFAAPVLLGVGGVALLTAAPMAVGQVLFVTGTVVQLAIYRALWSRQESGHLAMQVLGAFAITGSALLWWGGAPMVAVLPWFAAFLVLTIAGERLELARVGNLGSDSERSVLALALAYFAATVATALWPDVGHPLLGLALLALVVRLLGFDVARRLIRSDGLPRYMAWCLLAGYGWLGVSGGIWLLVGRVAEGPAYDAVIHAVFLGFTMSMIMAHAPVILPAVLGRPLPYRPAFYGPVVLLHASLLLRVGAGDLYEQVWALQVGGTLNVVAVLAFVVLAVYSVLTARRGPVPSHPAVEVAAAPPESPTAEPAGTVASSSEVRR